MAKYALDGAQAVASPDDTTITVERGGGRVAVYDFTVGSSATPADNALIHTCQRTTADGSGTAVTPRPLNIDEAAAAATSLENQTIEPTYTADLIMWKISANQRATYRWVAAPGGELWIADTSAAGLGWFTTHGSFTGSVEVMLHFDE